MIVMHKLNDRTLPINFYCFSIPWSDKVLIKNFEREFIKSIGAFQAVR